MKCGDEAVEEPLGITDPRTQKPKKEQRMPLNILGDMLVKLRVPAKGESEKQGLPALP